MPRVDPPLPPELASLALDLPPALLRFKPVPVRARQGGWSAERQRGFVVRLALCGSVPHAARAVGMSRESAYRLRARPDAAPFARAWDRALDVGRDATRDLALARALAGEVRPIFYRGSRVGEIIRYDERLALELLKRVMPVRAEGPFR